ncbi:hypothetical protein BDR26DRAFT_862055 [Obelidium mucronatum]|nr:hypothetical protein BDR26DRAFT_862055 [Obelidium mucronatum]
MANTLDANLLKLFAPRPPLEHAPPVDRAPAARRLPPIASVGQFLARCDGHDADYVPSETKDEKKKRLIAEKKKKGEEGVAAGLAAWDPNADANVKSDPYKTLFVGRLAYGVSEKQLRREFDRFGPILSLRIVNISENAAKNASKPRGYAFIEYERERDLIIAHREADGIKIEGRRIVVDVERGRTVKGWRPRRLGGGLGGTRLGGNDVNIKVSGRDGGNSTGGGHGPPPPSGGGHGGYGGGGRRDEGRYDDRRPGSGGGGFGGGYGGGRGGGYDDRRGGGRDDGYDRRGGYDDRRGGGGGFDRRGGGGGGYDRRRSRSPPRRY